MIAIHEDHGMLLQAVWDTAVLPMLRRRVAGLVHESLVFGVGHRVVEHLEIVDPQAGPQRSAFDQNEIGRRCGGER